MASADSIQQPDSFIGLIDELNISMRHLNAILDTARVAAMAEEDGDVSVSMGMGTMPDAMHLALSIIGRMESTTDKLCNAYRERKE